jgi:hypothetical protein
MLEMNQESQVGSLRSLRLTRAIKAVKSFAVLLFALVSFTSMAHGQADQGAITGLVTDSTGASVPGADVTVTATATGLVLHSKTDANGNYVFSPLKIGNYKVAATASGFSTTTQENIDVQVQERATANIQLKTGASNEVVTVTSAPPLLQTESGATGQVIETKAINETPLNGRNWVFIAQLAAGVAPSNGARGQNGGDFNANGQRAEQNNYIMDGVDNNVNVVDFFNGASYVVRPPPDALAEFKVQTGSYSSEFGHSAGAVVNASIKSGTNQIHGDLWEYVRNDAFDVREFFQGSAPIAKYRQNQFGATLGFPIFKDKLFFFGDVEADRIVFGRTTSGLTVPTAAMRTGDFSELLNKSLVNGNIIQLYAPNAVANGTTQIANNRLDLQPGVVLDPVALHLLSLFPCPNIGTGATGGNGPCTASNGPQQTYDNFTAQNDTTNNTFQWDTRMDWNISSKDQAFGRYSYNHEPANYPAPFGPILDGGGFGTTGQVVQLGENFAGSETHIFTPTLTNEFRFGYNYGHFDGLHENANNPTAASSLGLGGIPYAPNNGGLPFFSVSGLSNFGSPQFYATNEYENVYQILDNVTKVLGNHTIRGGVDIQRIRFSTSQPTQPRGTYTYTGLYTSQQGTANTGYGAADFLTNNMNTAAISNVFNSDDVRFNRAGYLQDDWKASERLTLNYGMRYDYSTPYLERHDNQAAFETTSGPTAGHSTGVYLIPQSKEGIFLPTAFTRLLTLDNIAIQYTKNRYLVNPQKTNFAPRVGFAYKATEKAVLHGGYGIFFGGLESTGYFPNLGENFPFEFDSNFPSGNCVAGSSCVNNGFTLENGFTNAIANGLINSISQPTLRGSEANVRTPYSEQYNFTVEYGFSNTMVGSVGYVGAVSRHLQAFPNPNGPVALAPNSFGSGYTTTAGDKVNPLQPYPHFGSITYTAYDGVSTYNSLQTKLEKRLSHGLSLLTTYTWSHSMDDAPTPLGSSNDSGYRSLNIIGIGADYGNSGFDVRQRFTLNGNYALPFGRGREHLNQGGVLDYVVGGWSDSFTFRAQTGEPISIATNSLVSPVGSSVNALTIGNPFKAGGSPNASNPGIVCPTKVRTVQNWYNPCAFANPEADNLTNTNAVYADSITASNPMGVPIPNTVTGLAALPYLGSPRSQTFQPGYVRLDMSLFKSFPTFREQAIQFRADAFNLLNTPAYGAPGQNGTGSAGISSTGGLIQQARSFSANTPDSRFFQFALKYTF